MSGRMFPGRGGREVGPGQIPWKLILRHEPQALRNHSQTIERLAERGGLGWGEAHAVLKGYRMRTPYMNQAVARAEVEAMVAEWESNDDRNHIAYLEAEVRELLAGVGWSDLLRWPR